MELDRKQLKISKESVLKFFPEKIDIPPILNYESPIKVIMGNMRMEQEDNIFKAVQEYGVDVNKDELIKALQYDREQYEKGYINGYNARASDVAKETVKAIKDEVSKKEQYFTDLYGYGGYVIAITDLEDIIRRYIFDTYEEA